MKIKSLAFVALLWILSLTLAWCWTTTNEDNKVVDNTPTSWNVAEVNNEDEAIELELVPSENNWEMTIEEEIEWILNS